METTYRIVNCRWQSGERYRMLVDAETGQPLWWPTLFITTQLRSAGRSVATMEGALRAIHVLLAYAETYGIDLDQRVRSGQYLALHEVDALSDSARRSFDRRRRRGGTHRAASVSKAHHYNRLNWIAAYLEWYAHAVRGNGRTRYDDKAIETVVKEIRRRRPRWGRGVSTHDRALTDEQCDRLLRVIEPGHPDNPFEDRRAAERNELAVLMLLRLGVRSGELLGVQVPDIDWQQQWLSIHRRADDPEDPRMLQPRTKTLARGVPLFAELIERIDRYVRGARRQTKGANSHRYLLVVHRKGPHEGGPLSVQGLTKVFAALRLCDPMLAGVHPHSLRHTWNLKFSRALDGRPTNERASPAEEQQVRSHLMGWQPGSGTAAVYNQRHISEKAQEAARVMYENAKGNGAQEPSNG